MDKERSLVPAIRTVFAGIPHQFCQTHYLGNLARPLDKDDHQLEEGVQEVVYALRKIERTIEHLAPQGVGEAEQAEPKASATETATVPGPPMVATTEQTSALPPPPLPADPTDTAVAAEIELARTLVEAGKTAGAVSGRPITNPPGLKRFLGLQRVGAAAAKAARKRGLQTTVGN